MSIISRPCLRLGMLVKRPLRRIRSTKRCSGASTLQSWRTFRAAAHRAWGVGGSTRVPWTDNNQRNREIMPNTIRLHRVLRASPEKVYRAFLDADAMTKWLPPNGFTGKVHHMDAKVGGSFKMSFTNFSSGSSISFGGEYLELLPHERIRYTDRFDDPNLPGVIEVTVVLKRVSCGTDVSITQEGVPDVIPVEACYLGWQESLTLLSQLVEVELPG